MTAKIAAVLFAVACGGCVATTGSGSYVHASAQPVVTVTTSTDYEEPDLVDVEVSPGVQVVADYEEPVFHADNFYWRFSGGIWYRSTVHTGGWVVYEDVPVRVRSIERPHTYVHYRPTGYVPRARHAPYKPHDRPEVHHDPYKAPDPKPAPEPYKPHDRPEVHRDPYKAPDPKPAPEPYKPHDRPEVHRDPYKTPDPKPAPEPYKPHDRPEVRHDPKPEPVKPPHDYKPPPPPYKPEKVEHKKDKKDKKDYKDQDHH